MKKSKVLHLIIEILLIIIIIFCLYKIGLWLYDNYKSKKVKDNYKDVQEKIDNTSINKLKTDDINIKELKEQNPDTVGWLKVPNTNISYPIVKTNDNDYYLNHSFDKSYNSAGWPFMDYNNNINKDKNIVIYGHNRRNGDMFGTLYKTLKEDWYTNNKEITFITENEVQIYEVYSVYEVLNEEYYVNTNLDNNSYSEFLDTISKRSYYNFNVNLDINKPTLTLSTCSGNDKYRTVLHAIKKD